MKFTINKKTNSKGSHLGIDTSMRHIFPELSKRYACKMMDLLDVCYPDLLRNTEETKFINFMRDVEYILRIAMTEANEDEV